MYLKPHIYLHGLSCIGLISLPQVLHESLWFVVRMTTCSVYPSPCRNAEIVPFFKVIESDQTMKRMILDYSISQTTLEEVFLNVSPFPSDQFCQAL